MTEQEIVQAAMTKLHATGSEEALAELAKYLRPRIKWFFSEMGRTDAADLTEETFRIVARHRDKFEPGKCAYIWVFSIATRLLHLREREEVINAKREVVERRLEAICGRGKFPGRPHSGRNSTIKIGFPL